MTGLLVGAGHFFFETGKQRLCKNETASANMTQAIEGVKIVSASNKKYYFVVFSS